MAVSKIRKKELLRFLVGGGSAVLVDYITYKLFMMIGFDRNIAKGISFICGSAVGFVINKCWTFESCGFKKNEIIKYIALYSCTACINAMVNKMVLLFIPMELFGFLCATGVSTILNFLGQKYFVFCK